MKVALVYDRVNKWGGAERVLLALHKLFPDAPLYTSVYNKKKAPWAKVFDVRTSFLQKFPFAKTSHELYAFLMPLAFESFSFDEYDLVISVTSEAAKGIITKPQTKHICYCLTPTRYLWSGYKEYFNNTFFRFITKPIVSYLGFWDKIAAQRPDKYVSISKEVQSRIKKYYKRESKAIYPPLTFNFQNTQNTQILRKAEIQNIRYSDSPDVRYTESSELSGKYFLIVSRLVPYKRIDIAIRAFNKLKLPLKIVGIGSEAKKLKRIARSNIEFLNNLTDEELISYYTNCIALIFPANEDFGLAVLEAQSFGKPVIAFRGGGVLETIIEGETGEFFDRQTVESLIEIVNNFNKNKYKGENCLKNTERFSFERFEKGFVNSIKNIL